MVADSLLRNYNPEDVRNILAVAVGVLSLVSESDLIRSQEAQLADLAGDSSDQLCRLAEAITIRDDRTCQSAS